MRVRASASCENFPVSHLFCPASSSRNLITTGIPCNRSSRARKTTPTPPRPSSRSIRYRPLSLPPGADPDDCEDARSNGSPVILTLSLLWSPDMSSSESQLRRTYNGIWATLEVFNCARAKYRQKIDAAQATQIEFACSIHSGTGSANAGLTRQNDFM